MRLSSYSILADRIPGFPRVIMNGISGALDSLSEPLADAVEKALLSRSSREVLEMVDRDTRAQLVERGHLTEWSEDEERQIVTILAHDAHAAMVGKPSFMIVPNLDCNYRCTYCFERPLQNTLKSGSAEISHHKNNVVMSLEKVTQSFDAIEILRAEKGLSQSGQVILYGGEPLDRHNETVVRAIVREGIARGVFFAAITNGHDLDFYIDVLGRGKIEQIQISIDGLKETHDKRRIFIGHESSFDRIVCNIQRVISETDAEVQIRSHVDPQNIAKFSQLIDFFATQGWLDHPQIVIYGNTVYERGANGGVGARISVADIDRALSNDARRAGNIYTSAPEIHAERSILPALIEGERVKLKGTYCSANSGNYIFAPDSSIYACWESVGKSCSRIGTYGENGAALDEKATARWFGRSIAALPGCQTCAYALVCGGGCAQYAEYDEGTLYASYCDDFQRTYRSALARTIERHLISQGKQEGDAQCLIP